MNVFSEWNGLGDLLIRLGSAARLDTGPWAAASTVLVICVMWAIRQQLVEPWRRRASADQKTSWLNGLLARVAVPTGASLLFLGASRLLQTLGRGNSLLLMLSLLAGLLACVRVLIFLARHWRGSVRVDSSSERIAAWVVWAIGVAALVWGIRPAIDVADSIAIPIGGVRVSLLDAARVVIVVFLFVLGAAYLGGFVERRLMKLTHVPIGIRVGTSKVTRVVLIVVASLIAFNAVGVNLTALTVFSGAVGVGLGFGLQRIASNFVSGFILLGDRSIRPGDVITIGTRFGVVRELRARYVVVRDRDGVDTLIPNENIITSEVINWSYADRHIRLKLPVQISYRDNPRAAMALMEGAARQHSRVEAEPQPVARIIGFGENGIDLELRFWIVDPEDGVMNIRSDLYLAVWDAFQTAGITIPYPQRDLNFPGMSPASAKDRPSVLDE